MEAQQTLGGRYKLLNELGSGGMAVVWRARDEVLGRPVAVKLLARRLAGDPQSRARIRDEARAAAALSHPNIAQVYDYGESGETAYVVMELINGLTLQQRVADGPLPPRTVFRICGEVAAALAAAHDEDLVHRDIKMANIMVTAAGVKVVDFGIAAAAGLAAPEEMLVGTPAYLAPERLTGDSVEPASDVYALGVLLYRLLADESPWSVETTTQMLNAHLHLDPEPLPDLPGVPPAVTDLVARCLHKNPADRPTAAEVSALLGDAAEASRELLSVEDEEGRHVAGVRAPSQDRPVVAGRPDAVGNGRAPVPANKRKLLLAGGVAAVVIAASAAFSVLDDDEAGPSGPVAGSVSVAPVRSSPVGPAPTAGRPAVTVPAPATGSDPVRVTGGVPVRSTRPSAPASVPPSSAGGAVEPIPSDIPSSVSSPVAPEGTKFRTPGGVVYATCAQGRATLTDWQPAAGYIVDRVKPGPALTAEIVFDGFTDRYRTILTCVAGRPTTLVLPL